MDYKQIFIEGASRTEFIERIKPIFEKLVTAIRPDITNIVYVAEGQLDSLAAHMKNIMVERIKARKYAADGVIPMDEDKKEDVTMGEVIEEVKKCLIVQESLDTHYKWFAIIDSQQSSAALNIVSDADLIKITSNLARYAEKYNVSLHIPTEITESKMEAIDLHFNKETKKISFTSCRLGAPIIELNVSVSTKDEKGEDVIGFQVFRIPYGDPGSMYSDALLHLSDLSDFDKLSLNIRRFSQDSAVPMEVTSLEELKTVIFTLQKEMEWYGVLESDVL